MSRLLDCTFQGRSAPLSWNGRVERVRVVPGRDPPAGWASIRTGGTYRHCKTAFLRMGISLSPILLLWALVPACSAPRETPENRTELPSVSAQVSAYPPGRWRLASADDLARTVLWVSHIVVMHRDTSHGDPYFRPGEWVPDSIPSRSFAEARALATQIAERARSDPRQFDRLAAEYSDDVVSKSRGGSLGGIPANMLPSAFLDALSVLDYGEVSTVVKTDLGFHVLLKRFPPPRNQLSGSRVVVAYKKTFGNEDSARTRQEAFALATSVTRRARAGEDFQQLIHSVSDALDRERNGELGVWELARPENNAIVLEELSRLEIGQVSDPVDTFVGWQVLKRSQPSEKDELAMRAIHIYHGPDDATLARQRAESIRLEVLKDPGAFERFQKEYCCKGVARWSEGHGDPNIAAPVEHLKLGEIAPEPFAVASSFLVVQRIDPRLLDPLPPPRFELPKPEFIDIESIVAANEASLLVPLTKQLVASLDLTHFSEVDREAVQRSFRDFSDALTSASTTTSERRLEAYRKALASMRLTLSERSYAELMFAIQRWILPQVLSNPRQ